MKRITKILLCVLCAVAAVLCVAAACFMLLKKQGGTTASSAASGASVSVYGKVSDFDYASFDYSEGLDDNGHWTGIRALDYVTLPDDVSALPLSKADIEPTETEIQTQIDTLLNQYATTLNITGRAAQRQVIAGGGAAGKGYAIHRAGIVDVHSVAALGCHTIIDGFEDQIIGHNIGDTFDVTVTFPVGYGDSTDAEGNTITLSGKEAVFSVTLNAITQSVVPTLTDEWVETNFAASDDLHTADALRQYFDSALYANNLDNAVMDYLLNNATFKEIPTQILLGQMLKVGVRICQHRVGIGVALGLCVGVQLHAVLGSIWPSRIWSFRPLRNSWISPPHRSRSTAPTAPTPTPTAHSAVC